MSEYARATQDYWHLCTRCGVITIASAWTAWQANCDEETEEEIPFLPSKFGETDPMEICPSCGHGHIDDYDSGFYAGTRREMEKQRDEDVAEQSEWWAINLASVEGEAGVLR